MEELECLGEGASDRGGLIAREWLNICGEV